MLKNLPIPVMSSDILKQLSVTAGNNHYKYNKTVGNSNRFRCRKAPVAISTMTPVQAITAVK